MSSLGEGFAIPNIAEEDDFSDPPVGGSVDGGGTLAPASTESMLTYSGAGTYTRVKFDENIWAQSGDTFWKAPSVVETLPNGVYRPVFNQQLGPTLVKAPLDTDELILLPEAPVVEVLDEIRLFIEKEHEFRKRKMLFKRGIFLYGPPGSGKTSAIHLLLNFIVKEQGGIALLADHPDITAQCLRMIRTREKKRQIICILEDLDALVMRYGESDFLALLDGESQVDNIVFVATTNYMEKLDKRFKDRPSRFDLVKYIGMPSDPVRRAFVKAKEPGISDPELEKFVELSKDFSLAHLRELVILTKVFGNPVEAAAERMQKQRNTNTDSTSTPDNPKFGF